MNKDLLRLFLEEDCDQHARFVLLDAITKNVGVDGNKEFTFNRFNVRLEFGTREAVIDDDLNPSDGEFRLPLEDFAKLVLKTEAV